MLEIVKYGSNQYGVWVLGHLKIDGLDIYDIFNTNLKDEELLKNNTSIRPKLLKITRNKSKNIVFRLEF